MKRLANYFLRGLVLIAPVAITIYACVWIFRAIDGLLGLPVPGLGFVLTLAVITLVGFLASNLLAMSFVSLLERVMTRLPFIRLLYTSTKDLLDAFVGEKRRFDTPVMVEVTPDGGAKALGFVTMKALDHLGVGEHVAVYFPQSYNFAGNLLLVPSERVTPLEADSTAVMAFIVSGGVTGLRPTDDPRSVRPRRRA
ncbi:MAG TPA: DUF502 domain-containing protein [Gemmatimonadaceae bacterium]|nr:DUF502 domain-containing protein [Gemmatimonadaceae bacterium]